MCIRDRIERSLELWTNEVRDALRDEPSHGGTSQGPQHLHRRASRGRRLGTVQLEIALVQDPFDLAGCPLVPFSRRNERHLCVASATDERRNVPDRNGHGRDPEGDADPERGGKAPEDADRTVSYTHLT